MEGDKHFVYGCLVLVCYPLIQAIMCSNNVTSVEFRCGLMSLYMQKHVKDMHRKIFCVKVESSVIEISESVH